MKLTITEATLLVNAIHSRVFREREIADYWQAVLDSPDEGQDVALPEDVQRWENHVSVSHRNIATLEDLRKRIIGEYLS